MVFLARRILTSVILLIATSIAIFVVLRALPGDPVAARLGAAQGIDAAAIQRLRVGDGLDKSLLFQYQHWIVGLLHGDFGRSYFSDQPVAAIISQRLPPTLELTGLAVLLSILIAVPLAVAAAQKAGGVLDKALNVIASMAMSFPPFVAGILLILLFSVTLHLLPARGYTPFTQSPLRNLEGMILPSIALALVAAPLIFRFMRGTMIEALRSNYVRTAEGKGASLPRVLVRHALRNAMLPGLTVAGLITGYTLGGSVIVEYVFGFSGLGSLSVEAAFRRDYSVLQTVVLLISSMFIIVSLVVDLLIWHLDPRTRVSRG